MKAKFNKLFTLLTILTLGITNVWAVDVTFSAAEIAAGTAKSYVTPHTPASTSNSKICTSSNVPLVQISKSADASWNDASKRMAFTVAEGKGVITSVTIHGSTNSTSNALGAVIYWDDLDFPSKAIGYEMPTFRGYVQNNTCDNHYIVLSPTSGTKAFAIYRRVKFDPATLTLNSGSNVGAGTTLRIDEVVITIEPECDATVPGNISKGALNAGTLTLNAAGYGSKPAKDEWYWQTAEDGVDKSNSGASFDVTAAGTYYVRSLYDNDCWSDAKSITITSTDLVENYTVVYKDGTTELGSEVVAVGSHPAGIADPTKDCYTFAGWMNGSTPVADVTALSGTADEEIELTATWTPVYSSTLDFAAITVAGTTGANPIGTFLASGNMVSKNLSSSAWETSTAKSGYIGYKLKDNNAEIKFLVQAGKQVVITFGSIAAAVTLSKNGVNSTISAASGDNAETVVPAFVPAEDMLVSFKTSSTGTVTIKKIAINSLYTATYIDDENGNSSENNVAQVTLGTPTGSKTFMGWKADQAVTVDDEVVAANTTIAGGKTAVLSANTTFTAQWSDAAFTVTYYDGATELGSENVVSGGNPFNYADYQTKAMATFDGWYSDSELNTPIADISALTITANTPVYGKWTSTDARLSAIEFSSNAGTLSPAFNPEVVNYTYTMPYKTADIPTITGATSVNANAQAPIIGDAATAWGETQTITGKAQSGDTKIYTITMQVAPKDGVAVISIDVPNGTGNAQTIDESKISGFIGGTATQKLQSGATKLGSNGHYIGFTLANSETLKAGDIIRLDVSANNGASHLTLYQDASNANLVKDIEWTATNGVNLIPLPTEAIGLGTLYIYRTSSACNPSLSEFAILRSMNPMLTAITINGQAGVIDEGLKTVAVELQPGYDLAALTIVPTIVSNTDEALVVKTVTSNEGNWVLGPNTYRLTDKDGDYTEYTVTLTAGALKYAVTFDTDGGNTIDPVEVVADGYLAAGDVPADPIKEDYLFQGWTLGGSLVADLTSVQIDGPKTFVATWAPDGAIKLLDGSTVNHTNFITGVTADETVEFKGNTVNYAKFYGTCGSVNNVKDLTKSIIYNATTNKTKIRISAHNNSTSARSILVKGLVEGATEAVDLATIALGNKEDKVSEWIEFDNAANRTIYIMVPSSAGDVYFTQVKVIESGTDLKMAGEAGYSLNFDHGRFFGVKDVTAHFEGLDVEVAGSDCQPLNTSVVKLASSSISFDVAAPLTLAVTTNNNKTYYVTKDAAGTDNETTKTGVSEFSLTAGTWFITGGASNVEITNIAFTAPKCAEPSFASLTNSDICAGDPYVALDGTATVADAGVPTYQWYNADGDVELVGETGATYTPSADGSYYVIATNHLAGFADNAKQSATVTVTTFASANITSAPLNQRGTAGDDATLTVAATGKNLSYQWFTCDNEAGDNPTVMAGEENASLTVTIPSGTQWYKVVVSSDCGNVDATAKVEEFVPATPQNVTESTTWDWKSTTAGFPTENSSIDFANTSVEELLANVSSLMPNNDAFHSDMLYGIGQRAWRKSNNDGECGFQGFQLRFHTEVAGRVRVYFRAPSSGQTSVVRINGNEAGSRGNSWGWSQYIYVDANSDVVIAMTNGETGMTRVQKMEFQTPDYTRTEMLGNGVLGTLCVDHNVPVEGIQGATFYELVGRNTEGKIAFDQITTGQLDAGKPYVFQANGDKLALYYGTETEAAPVNGNGMYGTFTDITLTELDDVYYFAQKALWSCTDLTSLSIPANRAYVKLSEIPSAMAPAPGRIRMTLNVNGAPAVTTGMENLENNETPVKMLINGQLFIMRGEKLYDATGRLVK